MDGEDKFQPVDGLGDGFGHRATPSRISKSLSRSVFEVEEDEELGLSTFFGRAGAT